MAFSGIVFLIFSAIIMLIYGADIYTKHADTWCESGYDNFLNYLAVYNVEEDLAVEECKGACDNMDPCEAFGYKREHFLCLFYESCVFEENNEVDTYVRSANGGAETTEDSTTAPNTDVLTTEDTNIASTTKVLTTEDTIIASTTEVVSVVTISRVITWMQCGMACQQDLDYHCLSFTYNQVTLECVLQRRQQTAKDYSQVIAASCVKSSVNPNINKWICE